MKKIKVKFLGLVFAFAVICAAWSVNLNHSNLSGNIEVLANSDNYNVPNVNWSDPNLVELNSQAYGVVNGVYTISGNYGVETINLKLTEDINYGILFNKEGSLYSVKNVNLDLNGFTITAPVDVSGLKLTMQNTDASNAYAFNLFDTSVNKTGKILGLADQDFSTVFTEVGVDIAHHITFNMYGGEISNFNNNAGDNHHWGTNDGGGLLIYSESIFNFYDGVIQNNSAANGGGIQSNGATINIYNGIVKNNRAAKAGYISSDYGIGGGINLAQTPMLNMYGGEVSGNVAEGFEIGTGIGGGIAASYTTSIELTDFINITNAEIKNNNASRDGGGLYINIPPTGSSYGGLIDFDFTGSKIYNNKAGINGGGIYINTYNNYQGRTYVPTLKNINVQNNAAGVSGGGIYATEQTHITLEQSAEVNKNSAGGALNTLAGVVDAGSGAGIYLGKIGALGFKATDSSEQFNILNNIGTGGIDVNGNYVELGNGGGLFGFVSLGGGNEGDPDLNLNINNNITLGNGGGVYGGFHIPENNHNNVVVKANQAATGAGAYLVFGNSSSEISKIEITNNTATVKAGGIYVERRTDSEPSLGHQLRLSGNGKEFIVNNNYEKDIASNIYISEYSSIFITNNYNRKFEGILRFSVERDVTSVEVINASSDVGFTAENAVVDNPNLIEGEFKEKTEDFGYGYVNTTYTFTVKPFVNVKFVNELGNEALPSQKLYANSQLNLNNIEAGMLNGQIFVGWANADGDAVSSIFGSGNLMNSDITLTAVYADDTNLVAESLEDYTTVYNGIEKTFEIKHSESEGLFYKYTWTLPDNSTVNGKKLTVKNVADSGIYYYKVSSYFAPEMTSDSLVESTSNKIINVSITPKSLEIKGNAYYIVIGQTFDLANATPEYIGLVPGETTLNNAEFVYSWLLGTTPDFSSQNSYGYVVSAKNETLFLDSNTNYAITFGTGGVMSAPVPNRGFVKNIDAADLIEKVEYTGQEITAKFYTDNVNTTGIIFEGDYKATDVGIYTGFIKLDTAYVWQNYLFESVPFVFEIVKSGAVDNSGREIFNETNYHTQLTAEYGDNLNDIKHLLEDGYSFVEVLGTNVGGVGTRTFSVEFTPNDQTTMNKQTLIIEVVVAKKGIERPVINKTDYLNSGNAQVILFNDYNKNLISLSKYVVSNQAIIGAEDEVIVATLKDPSSYYFLNEDGSSGDQTVSQVVYNINVKSGFTVSQDVSVGGNVEIEMLSEIAFAGQDFKFKVLNVNSNEVLVYVNGTKVEVGADGYYTVDGGSISSNLNIEVKNNNSGDNGGDNNQGDQGNNEGMDPIIFIIIGAVVALAAAGTIIIVVIKRKKK